MRNTDTASRFRRGLATIWFVLLGLVLVGITGTALDTGFVLLVANQLQNAADAGAIEGARLVQTNIGEARQVALDIVFENDAAKSPVQIDLNSGNDVTGDIVVGRYSQSDKTFTPTVSFPNAVKVVTPRSSTGHQGSSCGVTLQLT